MSILYNHGEVDGLANTVGQSRVISSSAKIALRSGSVSGRDGQSRAASTSGDSATIPSPSS